METNAEKPFIEQIQDNIPSGEEVQKTMSEGFKGFGENMNEIRDGVKSKMSEFSSNSGETLSDASKDFLDSNSLLAKFSFIIFVVIVFMLLLKVCMGIMAYFVSPSTSPYIVKGSIYGNDRIVITQEPGKDDTKQILKSNDRGRGMEFTWSVWLFLNETTETGIKNIFLKGNENFGADDYNVVNGPGLYLQSKDNTDAAAKSNEYELTVVMDHLGGQETKNDIKSSGRDVIMVDSIPIRKWVHVAVRMQNTVLDVYVNGTIAKRHNMEYAPKQNFNDVVIGGHGGFPGKLSNLRYYSHALNVFEINNIVMFGPNTSPSELSVDAKANTGTYSYLSNLWYSDKY
jgi:hypothetical protein